MARQRTVAQMLLRLAEAVDLPAFSDSPATFISQTRAIEYLSDSVHAFAQKHRAFGLLAATATINAVSGTKSYALPTDFAALINITTTVNGCPRKLVRLDIDDIDLQPTQATSDWFLGTDTAGYCLLGDNLIMTDLRGSYTLQMRYVPELPMFNFAGTPIADFSTSVTTDYILTKGTIDQWVVLDSALKVQRKRKIDPSPFREALDQLEANLIQNVAERDEHDARTVRNAWDDDVGGYGGGW